MPKPLTVNIKLIRGFVVPPQTGEATIVLTLPRENIRAVCED
jgi:hypothetical protein